MSTAGAIERFLASRGYTTKKLNPPARVQRQNKSLLHLSLIVSFGWGQKNGVAIEKKFVDTKPCGISVRLPILGYQLCIALHFRDARTTEESTSGRGSTETS